MSSAMTLSRLIALALIRRLSMARDAKVIGGEVLAGVLDAFVVGVSGDHARILVLLDSTPPRRRGTGERLSGSPPLLPAFRRGWDEAFLPQMDGADAVHFGAVSQKADQRGASGNLSRPCLTLGGARSVGVWDGSMQTDKETLYRFLAIVLSIAALLAILRWLVVSCLRSLRTLVRAFWPH